MSVILRPLAFVPLLATLALACGGNGAPLFDAGSSGTPSPGSKDAGPNAGPGSSGDAGSSSTDGS